ncbi:MAG: BPSL0067 family protein [Candidatus Peribacteria bacterium]|nr:BPSL0067 family protein [Candidatus Peribacteria bacterium]
MLVSIFSLLAVNSAIAQPQILKVTPDFVDLIEDEIEPSPSTFNGTVAGGWTLRYSFSMEDNFYYYFPNSNPVVDPIVIGSSSSINNFYLSVSTYNDWSAPDRDDNGNIIYPITYPYKGQCATFVKIATNTPNIGSGSWMKGDGFSLLTEPPEKGTVLATFSPDKYGVFKYDGSHVLIYWGQVPGTTNQFYVIDQNWYTNSSDPLQSTKCLIRKHIMSVSGTEINDLSNYSIVTY